AGSRFVRRSAEREKQLATKACSRCQCLNFGYRSQDRLAEWQPLTLSYATRTLIFVKRKFHVTLLERDEGVSVSCPELPGCIRKARMLKKRLQNIEDAVRGYIDLYGEPDTRCEIREMEVVTA